MADLNALIAQGAQFAAPPDPFAQYGKMQQLRVGENQNALAQYQLESAKRTDLQQNALNRAYSDAVNSDTGLIDYGRLSKSLVASGAGSEIPAVLKQQAEFKEAQDKSAKLQSELLANKLKLLPDAYKMANTPEAYIDLHKSIHADPILGPWLKSTGATPERGFAQIQDAIKNGTFDKLRMDSMQSVDQLLEGLKPKTDIGKLIEARNQLPLNDPNRKLYDQEISDRGAANRNAQQRLDFDRAKFAWEKANPGYELKEDANGGVVGVNKRTLEAIPVTVGGATPPVAGAAAAVPAAPSVTVDGRSFPGVRTDAPAIVGPRTQLIGKTPAMTETQSNAATFGGAMMQAQNTIAQLEKTGTVKNAVVPGLLTGLAKLVPLGVGENLGNVIESTFNADPTGLIGPNADQQRLAQAQLSFSIAYLRKTSGAAFGAKEVSNTIQEYFPVIGDSDKVIAQKAAARKRAIDGMRISTNAEGKKYIDSFKDGENAPVGSNPNDPLNLGVR